MWQYVDIIYKAYTGFSGPSWVRYNEKFRMRAALNPALRWDQIHPQLWLQVMTASRPSFGNCSDSGHVVTRSSMAGGPQPMGGQSNSNKLLCWEFTSQGVCNRKPCKFHHESPLCGGAHSFLSCPKPKGKGGAPFMSGNLRSVIGLENVVK